MRAKVIATIASVCLVSASLMGQSGPDNDPDGAIGYTTSIFQHNQVDSINLYNGTLVVPISLGPSYPIGPKLRFQLMLYYNSQVTGFGSPVAQTTFSYEPLMGNPALGIGWELTLGAIKTCRHGLTNGVCYFAPDGSQHMFNKPQGNGMVTGDATQYFLQGSGPYDMWDGDGNHYFFTWQVKPASGSTRVDDVSPDISEGYTHNFGRGREGWYLSQVIDPFGNTYSASYYPSANPCWTRGSTQCNALGTDRVQMRTCSTTVTQSWIPQYITLPSSTADATTKIKVSVGNNGSIDNMITGVTFPVALTGGAGTPAVWDLGYDATATLGVKCGKDVNNNDIFANVNAQVLKTVTLPADSIGTRAFYQFAYFGGLLQSVTLPTAGQVQYCWGEYDFYHGRSARIGGGCAGFKPDASDPSDAVPGRSGLLGGACPAPYNLIEPQPPPQAPEIGQCTQATLDSWKDHNIGIIERTETLGSVNNTTLYYQYFFPWGESGTLSAPLDPDTLTVVTSPAIDMNKPTDAGKVWARAVHFQSATHANAVPPNSTRASVPGDRVGAELDERIFDGNPNQSSWGARACGNANATDDAAFCATKAVRVTLKTYDYDSPTNEEGNRRLLTENTIFGASNCGTCANHQALFSPAGAAWETEGRHYTTETHKKGSTTLRTITTDWNPINWTTGPVTGNIVVLPNIMRQRTLTDGTSVVQNFDFAEGDASHSVQATGFLNGSYFYDSARGLSFLSCRKNDGVGNASEEYTKTKAGDAGRTYCSTAAWPTAYGSDSDLFLRRSTYKHGELLTTGWVNAAGSVPFKSRNVQRDDLTGWTTSSADENGLATTFSRDAFGRVTQVVPPDSSSVLSTRVCYEGPTSTTVYRAQNALTCPVASSATGVLTWVHADFDKLGRLFREKRLLPTAGVVEKFRLYDAIGNARFVSEWVPDGTDSTAINGDRGTNCAFASGLYATNRPSAAPGTYRMCFDPFGRPQQVVGAGSSSLVTTNRTDGSSPYSDTVETVTTYCVNGQIPDSTFGCTTGFATVATTTTKDFFGRITQVVEPSADNSSTYTTTYTNDPNGKVLSVTQGGQGRTFTYDSAGFLRSEMTPEKATVTYNNIGSQGNVIQETRNGSLVVNRTFDFAGRLGKQDAGGHTFLVNCFDGAALCADGTSAGYSAGAGDHPLGRLNRRYGSNWIPLVGPTVDERFEYTDAGGRLSKQLVDIGNGDLNSSVSQVWSYTNLGLVNVYTHPSGFQTTNTYTNGLPTLVKGNTQTIAMSVNYNPSAGVSKWTAGNTGTAVVTTISQDTASYLARPTQIKAVGSATAFDTGAYKYDGSGNVLFLGSDSFGYDALSRVNSVTYSAGARSLNYDRWGNLTQNGPQSFIIDSTHNQVSCGPYTPPATCVAIPAYDPRGNTTGYDGDTMSFDELDRLYHNQNSGSDWVYLYNGVGERIVKVSGASILRREMARLITEANKVAGKLPNWSSAPDPCPGTFADVPCPQDNDSRYIQTVANHGVSAGCGGGNFCPDSALTRGQMAVFLVRGYQADGAPTPMCTGTIFTDVPCTGGPFDPYIEQLSRDFVTSGCGGGKFCPGNPVTPWQIMVWMAKAPAVPTSGGSVAWASVYHPVPRGSTYTWRDERDRVSAEATDNASGSLSAALTYTRDNVFLGSLLVGSYDNNGAIAVPPTPADWWFSVSDHLGSPRYAFNKDRSKSESHQYWPFGEDVNTIQPAQKLAFAQMEKDDGANRFYDHARSHQFKLGRFVSPDQVGGRVRTPQSWNRYSYSLNNPLKYLDPNGRQEAVAATVVLTNPVAAVAEVTFLYVYASLLSRVVVNSPTVGLPAIRTPADILAELPRPQPVQKEKEKDKGRTKDEEQAKPETQGDGQTDARARQPGDRARASDTLADRIEQLDEINRTQEMKRGPKGEDPIQSTEKSRQRVDDALKRIKSSDDIEDVEKPIVETDN